MLVYTYKSRHIYYIKKWKKNLKLPIFCARFRGMLRDIRLMVLGMDSSSNNNFLKFSFTYNEQTSHTSLQQNYTILQEKYNSLASLSVIKEISPCPLSHKNNFFRVLPYVTLKKNLPIVYHLMFYYGILWT